jgi:hypothetical protein
MESVEVNQWEQARFCLSVLLLGSGASEFLAFFAFVWSSSPRLVYKRLYKQQNVAQNSFHGNTKFWCLSRYYLITL